ncbi:PorV/PorQ family protein [bacterium]|nr:PorV/PorQ family protein [bacterium]
MKKFVFSILLLIIFPLMLWGQAKVGTAGAQFLEIGVGARSIGMGEAFKAVANDATALYYNPGGVAWLTKKEVAVTYIKYPANISYGFVGLLYPMRVIGGSFGLAWYGLSTGEIEETTWEHTEGTGRTFYASDMALGLTYSRMLTDKFSTGVTLKYIGEFYANEQAHGWAVDIGTLYFTDFKSLRIGANISNFGPDMKFIQDGYPLPMSFHFGLAGEVFQTPTHKLTLAGGLCRPSDNLEKYSAGLEYWYRNNFALRFGKKISYDDENFSAGAGLALPIGKFEIKLDYAYTHYNYLSDSHITTLHFLF